jgi:hypothetical protein
MISSLGKLATLDLENIDNSINTQSTNSYTPYVMDPSQIQGRPIITTEPNAGGDFDFINPTYKI